MINIFRVNKDKLLLLILISTFLFSCSKNKPFTVYMVGDSTMSIKKPEVAPETGWGMVLPEIFDTTVTVKNHAKNGRSTKSFLNEGRWKVVWDSLKKGDYVFIQFGHNDEKINSPERFTKPYGEYSLNLISFVKESRNKGATPILFTPIVRRKFDDNGKLINTHGDYPDAMKKVAKELKVPLIDLNKLTHHMAETEGGEKSKQLYLWTEPSAFFPEGRQDDTHLSKKGAKEVALLAVNELVKLDCNWSNYLKK